MADFTWDHLHLRSPDPEMAARFYVDTFGATETGRTTNNGALRVILSLSGIPLFIEQVPAGTDAPPAPPFLGLEHFGLRVGDLDAVAAALRAKGVQFTKEPASPRPGLKIAFVQAPDGVQVELLERSAA